MQKATNKVVELKPQDDREPWEIEFERCQHWIEKALKYQDFYTIEDIKAKISYGMFHLWPGKRSAMITELVIFPQNKALNLIFCGGDYTELEDMLPSIEKFARKLECKRLYGGGRKGWLRKIQHLGFEADYMVKKEL
jgi:hypothetical protein